MHCIDLVPKASGECVLAIGNFDGVHLGHQFLLKEARAIADANHLGFSVLTFFPHPREYFKPDLKPLNMLSIRSKIKALRNCGVERLYFQYFNAAFAQTSAVEFMDFCVEKLRARHIVTGENFTFGKGREGSPLTLQAEMNRRGLAFTAIPPLNCGNGEVYSSTRIRTHLQVGHIKAAAQLLGRSYTIEGRVMHGDKRGRELGYPTANISLSRIFRPAFGIYAAEAEVNGQTYAAAVSIGIRPQFAGKTPVLEAHLLDFKGNLYGRRLTITLLHYLRPEQVFDSTQSLIDQMGEDVVKVRQYYQAKG